MSAKRCVYVLWEVPNPEYDPPENEEELEDYDVPKTIEVEQEYMVTVPEKDMPLFTPGSTPCWARSSRSSGRQTPRRYSIWRNMAPMRWAA